MDFNKQNNNFINLDTSLQFLKGVGPKKAQYLQDIGLSSIRDLFFYFPRNWEDRIAVQNIQSVLLYSKTRITIFGKIENTKIITTKSNIIIFEALISDDTGSIKAKWFRKKSPRYDTLFYLKNEIKKGKKIYITGELEIDELKVIDYEIPDENNETLNTNRIVPIYSASEKIDNKFIRKLTNFAIKNFLNSNTINPNFSQSIDIFLKNDVIPQKILKKHNFLDFETAIKQIHFPDNFDKKNAAYRRLAFNDFFILELVLLQQYQKIKHQKKKRKYILTKNYLTPFKESLDFEFTPDQKKVINEIFTDMLSDYPMNRLLQGDVGSGKTIVALSAMLLAIENDYQAAIMAPTEVLAKQHFFTFLNMIEKIKIKLNKNSNSSHYHYKNLLSQNNNDYNLKNKNIRIGFVIGGMKKREKRELFDHVKNGDFNIVVGTHALFNEDLEFKNLKLIIIDEQHKFGVNERLKLRDKAKSDEPDILVMTATPIPRSLAMSIYGDLDISTIKTMPKNKQNIDTFLTNQKKAIDFLISELKKGRQGYIVYPVIDENNKLELKSVEEMYKKLKSLYFDINNIKVGLLHGKMKQFEKDIIMEQFIKNELDVLIATTVIEVGIDIQNATVMIIEHAERFGLSTLHQLRGRVGRAEHKSYCCLVPSKMGLNAKERLSMMLRTNDGFLLAEKDLEMRGPGEFLGKNQHGFLELDIGDISRDKEIIEIAQKEAILFFEDMKKNVYSKKEIENLNTAIKIKYGNNLELLKV